MFVTGFFFLTPRRARFLTDVGDLPLSVSLSLSLVGNLTQIRSFPMLAQASKCWLKVRPPTGMLQFFNNSDEDSEEEDEVHRRERTSSSLSSGSNDTPRNEDDTPKSGGDEFHLDDSVLDLQEESEPKSQFRDEIANYLVKSKMDPVLHSFIKTCMTPAIASCAQVMFADEREAPGVYYKGFFTLDLPWNQLKGDLSEDMQNLSDFGERLRDSYLTWLKAILTMIIVFWIVFFWKYFILDLALGFLFVYRSPGEIIHGTLDDRSMHIPFTNNQGHALRSTVRCGLDCSEPAVRICCDSPHHFCF